MRWLVILALLCTCWSSVIAAPLIHLRDGTSINWGGYAIETSLKNPKNNAVTDVRATWVVPTAHCTITPNGHSSMWVGIDGYSDTTVEQTGTDTTCTNGQATYDAWFEFYPYYPAYIAMNVTAHDTMSADIVYLSNNFFLITMQDLTQHENFAITQSFPGAERRSAEWIVEAPSDAYGVVPLTDFYAATFTNASATLNSITGTIQNSNWQHDPITMTTTNHLSKADVTSLTNSNTFTMWWKHS